MGEDRQDNRLAAIRGPRRFGADTETGAPIGQSETPQAQISLQFDDMLAAGLIPLRIIGEVGGRRTELMGHKGDHGLRWLLTRPQTEAGIPEQA
jgi:hypothetical protein